jgi:hypothetical protein
MLVVCAIVLYGQAARFSEPYGAIGMPVFWVTGALLIGRPGALARAGARGARPQARTWVAVLAFGVLVLIAYPWLPSVTPGSVYDTWAERPRTDDRVVVPGFNRIPIADDGGAPSMAALIAQWRALGRTDARLSRSDYATTWPGATTRSSAISWTRRPRPGR